MVKVGINGFGRIGRNVLRAALNNPDIQIVAINDLTDSKTLAHLLKYDSLLGKLDAEVTAGEGGLVVDGKPITVFSERNPASIPWRQCEVDIVIEATGLFTDREKAAVHIHSGGAKRVIISAPGKNDDLTIVMGVNESLYSPDKHYVISNGSCTTNGLAPAAQVLHGSRLRWASVHHSTSAGGSVYGRDGTRHLSAENEAGIFLIITSVADQARLIHTAGGALSNEHFIWHPVTRSVRKCNSSKICRTVQAAGVAE